MQLIPSIFVTSAEQFLTQVTAVTNSVYQVQIDIADGQFVPATTWADPIVVKENVKTNCELHLMVTDPIAVIQKWIDVPQVKRVLFPAECKANIDEIIDMIHSHGWQAGLVLNPETSNDVAAPFLKKLDVVMFMGVHPGKQGQELMPEVLEKIAAFKKEHPGMFVELDGGVTTKNLGHILRAGVDAVCPGSAIFGNQHSPADNAANFEQQFIELKNWQF